MKSDASTKTSTKRSAHTKSRKASTVSPKANADTSLPYHLTPEEIESLRQDLRDTYKELDEYFADIEPMKR